MQARIITMHLVCHVPQISAHENLLLPPAVGDRGVPLVVQPLPQLLRHPDQLDSLLKR